MPMRGELSIPAGRMGGTMGEQLGWNRIAAIVTDPELLKVAGICAVGLAITVFLIYVSPSPGGVMEGLSLYP
jgi:hypothetical protein